MTISHTPDANLDVGWRPRLVALDIDGTLVDPDNNYSPAVESAVHAVLAAGAHVVLSTGRGLTATRPLAERLGLPKPYLVCSNGAVSVRLHPEPELLDVVRFDPAPVLRLLLERMPDVLVAVEELGVGYRVNKPFPPGELTGQILVEPLKLLVSEPATRVILREPAGDADRFLETIDRVGLHGVSYYIGYTAWLDIAPDGVSKATALEKVARRLGVAQADVLAIGDGQNDLEMLAWAGRGVAMGNAQPNVQETADAVTKSRADDGVAVELARWFDVPGLM
jgi:hydroxymethylpyrimidine pyrophosphatase-like HAD family hydrolase